MKVVHRCYVESACEDLQVKRCNIFCVYHRDLCTFFVLPLVGEPPGEKPNSYSENDEMKLPDSGLVISYSTRYYKFLDKEVESFLPDIRIDPNWKHYKDGRDAVME